MLCIFHIADQPTAARPYAEHIFDEGTKGAVSVEVPGIVRMELLVRPYRLGDLAALNRVRSLLELTRGVLGSELNDEVLMASAMVRAQARLKAPDALVVGSALAHASGAIVGNDKEFRRLAETPEVRLMGTARKYRMPRYIHLDDYLD
jgi:predicted nucleic acid-binding protein